MIFDLKSCGNERLGFGCCSVDDVHRGTSEPLLGLRVGRLRCEGSRQETSHLIITLGCPCSRYIVEETVQKCQNI